MKIKTDGPLGSRKSFFTYTSALAALAFAVSPAFAQDAPPPAEEEEDDVIIVTGTRIARPDYEFSNPVVSVGAEAIEYSGATNLTDFVQDLPALVNSFDSEDSADTGGGSLAGLNLLNLRNLGTERTLVLVNGRRHVASVPGSQAVDVNTIPIGLVERIEVQTGGASAVYGADGVTGVVNFVLQDDFEGFTARAQTSWSEQGGGENNFISLLGGTNFDGGRGNFTLAFEYSNTEPVDRDQRDFARTGERVQLVNNPAELAVPGDDPNIPDRVMLNDIRYIDTSPGGTVYTTIFGGPGFAGQSFEGDGDPWVNGVRTGGFTMQGGSGSLLDQFVDELLPRIERYSLNSTFNYEVNNGLQLFAEGKWSQVNTLFIAQPTFDFGFGPFQYLGMFLPIDNFYMPQSIFDDAMLPGNTGDVYGAVFMLRDNFDLGNTYQDIQRDTYRYVVGARGEMMEGLNYEVSYTWGRTDVAQHYSNVRITERWIAAMDVIDDGTGNPVCRSDTDGGLPPVDAQIEVPTTWGTTFTPGAGSGCVPINVFGPNISQEGRDWINTSLNQNTELTQQVLTGFITGDSSMMFSLPAGPIEFVFGGEYREEQSDYQPDELEALAVTTGENITWSGEGSAVTGSFDVIELFTEFNIPIVEDLPLFEEVSVDLAYRISDYSTAGSTETWNAGAIWRINDWLMLRGTEARAVRAPNVGELFTPQVQTFALLTDPCDNDSINSGINPALRFQNCAAALAAVPGAQPAGTFDNTSSAAIEGITGGNPDLRPEIADTSTYGFVFTPQIIEGLTFSVDYYKVDLSDAIETLSAQQVVNQCYDQPQPNDFCTGLTRTAIGANPGRIDAFRQTTVNVFTLNASGVDFTIRYDLDPANFGITQDLGQFRFALVGAKIDELVSTGVLAGTPDDDVGEAGAPEWQATFDVIWEWKDLTVNYGLSWWDETERVDPTLYANNPDYAEPEFFYYRSREVHDLYVGYEINETFRLYAGVNNFTDQHPDRGDLSYPVSPLGRQFYFGGEVSLSSIGNLIP